MTRSDHIQEQHQDPNWTPTPRAHAQYSKTATKTASMDRTSTTQGSKTNEQDEDKEEEEDEYEKRIARTGCSAENEALQMCYAEKHDWRACKDAMTAFRDCWKRNGNVEAEK